MLRGACLCGSIQFTISAELRAPRYCYCSHCTKFAGTSPASWAMVERAELDIDTGTGPVSRFNSGKGLRCFCSRCGSPVWFESLDYPDILAIPLGVLEGERIPAPEMHIWTGSKPGWCFIHDELPQHPGKPV